MDVVYEVVFCAFAEECYYAVSCDSHCESTFLCLEDYVPDLSVGQIVLVELGVCEV